MALSLQTFSDGTTMVASDVRANFEDVQVFMNERIAATDLKATAWLDTSHVYKPDFFGYPSHRFEGVGADVYYRQAGSDLIDRSSHHYDDGSGYDVVDRMGVSFRTTEDSLSALVVCTFYAFEAGGDLGHTSTKFEDVEAAQLALFVNGSKRDSTDRTIYCGMGYSAEDFGACIGSKKQHTIHWTGSIGNKGVKSISLRCKTSTRTAEDAAIGYDQKHLWVTGRSMFIDVWRR